MTLTETLAAATLAWGLGLLARLWIGGDAWRLGHHVAAFAILYPGLRAVVSFIDLVPLIGEFTVLRALTVAQLNDIPLRLVRRNLLVPAIGLAAAGLIGGWRVVRPHVASVDRPWPAWRTDLAIGVALVPLVVAAEAIALAALAGPASFLETGDETALYANATIVHVLLLSITPAVAEELYYRGLLQGVFEQVLDGRRGVYAAIGLQAVVFAVAHAGFTTVSHILGPLLFGLAMGYLRAVVGLGAAMVSHAAVNLFFFSVDPGAGSTMLLVAVLIVSIVGLALFVHQAARLVTLARDGAERSVAYAGRN